jgi:L-gulonate 3-dehydrogenase
MNKIWGDDVAAACGKPGRDAIDGDIKAAFGHVADLGMGMGMECAYGAFFKAEGNQHEFRPLGKHGAPVAGGNLGPHSIRRDVEGFAHFSCHKPFIAANVLSSSHHLVCKMTADQPVTDTAIIGSGFIGRAWAISFARAGARVRLWDQAVAQTAGALAYIGGVLEDLARNDLLSGKSPASVLSLISVASSMAEALAEATYVQENTPEVLATKIKVFEALDGAARADAILASSTSALLPSRFTEHLKGRSRCVVVHPINPPYLIPAAEIVPSPWTSPDTVERARRFLVTAGHAPLVMKRELDGFIMNRMQGALLEEAFRLVADGYASIEDIDIGIRDGLALRWSFMGPFETMDLNAPGGVRDYAERYQGIYENLFNQMQRRVDWTGEVMKTVEAERRTLLPTEHLQRRQVWRDKRLMALLAHKRGQATSETGS